MEVHTFGSIEFLLKLLTRAQDQSVLVFAVVVDLGLRSLADVLGVSVLVDNWMLVGSVLWSKLHSGQDQDLPQTWRHLALLTVLTTALNPFLLSAV